MGFTLLLFALWSSGLLRLRSAENGAPDDAAGGQEDASASVGTSEIRREVEYVHTTLANFMTGVKDPYRPPLGDNRDITRALTGENPYGEIFVPTNDPAIRDGQWIDRWGTPYWFHPRAPGVIDVRSAGPDRVLFTDDDVAVP